MRRARRVTCLIFFAVVLLFALLGLHNFYLHRAASEHHAVAHKSRGAVRILENLRLASNRTPDVKAVSTHHLLPTRSLRDVIFRLDMFADASQNASSCTLPTLHPSKYATKMGWGERRQPPPSCKRKSSHFSSLHEHGESADILFQDECRTSGFIWGFSEMHDSEFTRLTTTYDAEARQNELRDKYHVPSFVFGTQPPFVTEVKRSEGDGYVRNIASPYIIAICGSLNAIHVRAPRAKSNKLTHDGGNNGLNFMHIMLDSSSIYAMRRSAKRMTSWMEALNNDDGRPSAVFPFRHYHAVSCCSPGNQVPMYSGNMNGEGDPFIAAEPFPASADWVWNIARDRGMRTFWSLDNCPDKSARDYHAFPAVDSRVVAPLCLAGVLLSHKELGCVGGLSVDEMVLAGLESFWTHHESERKFAAIQFITPHEESEKLLIEVDILLEQFFTHLEHSGVLNNTAILIWSDHGINFGKYASTPDGEIEKLFPFANLILPRWFVNATGFATHLRENMDRLVTPFDMYELTREVLYFPQEPPPFKHDTRNPPLPQPSQSHIMASFQKPITPVRIASHTLGKERSCAAANIPVEFCTCIPWQQVDADGRYSQFIQRAIDAHRRAISNDSIRCHRITLSRVARMELQRWPTEYKPPGKDTAKRMWAMPNRDLIRLTYETAQPGFGVFVAVFSFRPGDTITDVDLVRLDRLDAMGKPCGVVERTAEHMCVCK